LWRDTPDDERGVHSVQFILTKFSISVQLKSIASSSILNLSNFAPCIHLHTIQKTFQPAILTASCSGKSSIVKLAEQEPKLPTVKAFSALIRLSALGNPIGTIPNRYPGRERKSTCRGLKTSGNRKGGAWSWVWKLFTLELIFTFYLNLFCSSLNTGPLLAKPLFNKSQMCGSIKKTENGGWRDTSSGFMTIRLPTFIHF
jgi:hypothetical protein